LLTVLALFTACLGYHAGHLRVERDFSNRVPQKHEYVRNYRPYERIFGGGNQIRVSVSRSEKSILDAEFLKMFRRITEDVMFVKGIDRRTVRSMVSPETTVAVINEEGFNLGPVVPSTIPETEAGLARLERNISLGGLKGRLVSTDLRSALIHAEIYETGADDLSVYRQLNQIRHKYAKGDVSVHINGFAMVSGFVNDALPKIILLFALSILITFLILYRCFRNLLLALLPLFSGGLSVVYALGIIRLIGITLDPMTTIIPFLVFAIGVSHGIQMVKRYLEECLIHEEGYDAALHALAGLVVPGTAALVTDAIGFLTLLSVPIGVIRELAVTASIGVACILVTNVLVLTLILSFLPKRTPPETVAPRGGAVSMVSRLLGLLSSLSHGARAYWVTGVAMALLVIGLISSRTVTVGDVHPGEPLLWEDSVYNQDAARMMADYMFGIDCLSVVVAGDEAGICRRRDVLRLVQDYEWEVGNIPGVTLTVSSLIVGKMINQMFHEGDIRWRELPQTPREIGWVMGTAGSTDDTIFSTMGCQDMNIRVFLADHKGETIRRVIRKSKAFIEAHPLEGARMLLAGGNAGIMAASNEVVGRARVPLLVLIYLSVFLLCLLVFRNLRAPLFIIAPLFVVSVTATAFMEAVGMGWNVNTLPVAALGVGIGVDYGIYFYSRLQEERRRQQAFAQAVGVTVRTTGAAVLYTALTLSAGVFTWLFSDLKFQAHMGLLLGFVFLANMVGAMVLLPALVYIFDVPRECAEER
jgi:hypothetical protein